MRKGALIECIIDLNSDIIALKRKYCTGEFIFTAFEVNVTHSTENTAQKEIIGKCDNKTMNKFVFCSLEVYFLFSISLFLI